MSSDNSSAVTPGELYDVIEEVKQHYRDPKYAAKTEFSDNEDIATIQMLTRAYTESATAAEEKCMTGHTEKYSIIGPKFGFMMKEIFGRIDVAKEDAALAEDAKTCQETWDSEFASGEQKLKTVADIDGLGRTLDRANEFTKRFFAENSKSETGGSASPDELREKVQDMSRAYSAVIDQLAKVEPVLGNLHKDHDIRTKLATWDSYRDSLSKLGSDVASQLPERWDKTLSIVNSTA